MNLNFTFGIVSKLFSMVNSSLPIKFKYKGDSHSIDVNTLIATQYHYARILNEINRLTDSSVKLSVKISSFQKGSFEVHQIIEIAAATGIFAAPNIHYVEKLFAVLANYVTIKSFLRGKKAEKVTESADGKVMIYLNGDNITVETGAFKIYQNNNIVNESLIKSSEALLNDEDIDGVEIENTRTNKKYIDLPREKIREMVAENEYFDTDTREDIVDATLIITKPELNPKKGSKWNFIYKGRKINGVAIKDEEFLKSVAGGLRFGNGDGLKVDMEIVLKYDSVYQTFLENRFEVILVKDILYLPEQTRLG